MNVPFLKFKFHLIGILVCVIHLQAESISINDALLKKVENSRMLIFKTPPKALILADDAFKEKISSLIKLQVPNLKLQKEEEAFKKLFLIPSTYQYVKCLSDALNQRALALYDFTTKTLIIKKGHEDNIEIISHELIHALQDQHFNLTRVQSLLNESTNRGLAIASLLEGDALVHQLKPDKKSTHQSTPSITSCTPPDTLSSLFLTPYEFGRAKVTTMVRDGSRATLNKFLDNVISSSNYFYLEDKALLQPTAHFSQSRFTDSLGPLFYKILLQKNNSTHESLLAIRGIKFDILMLKGGTLTAEVRFQTKESLLAFWNCLLKHFSFELMVPIDPKAKAIQLQISGKNLSLLLNEKGMGVHYTIK